jgi:hypothetical protein
MKGAYFIDRSSVVTRHVGHRSDAAERAGAANTHAERELERVRIVDVPIGLPI